MCVPSSVDWSRQRDGRMYSYVPPKYRGPRSLGKRRWACRPGTASRNRIPASPGFRAVAASAQPVVAQTLQVRACRGWRQQREGPKVAANSFQEQTTGLLVVFFREPVLYLGW